MEPCPEAKVRGMPCATVKSATAPVSGWNYEVVCPKLNVESQGLERSQEAALVEIVRILAGCKCSIISAYIPPIPPFAL
jgi:hypothetical protein